MKPLGIIPISMIAASAIVLGSGGCADDALDASSTPPADLDAGSSVDAPSAEGAASAEEDADASRGDAAPRVCSDDGFCQTPLPPILRDPNNPYDSAPRALHDVWSDGAGTAWSVSSRGEILRWDGAAWSVAYRHAAPRELGAVWGSSPTDLWVGGAGLLLHGQGATSSSIAWTEAALPPVSLDISSIWGSGAADIWAAGRERILHFDGATWTLDAAAPGFSYKKLWGSSASDVWVSGGTGEYNPDSNSDAIAVLRRAADGTWNTTTPGGACSSLRGWGEHSQDERNHTVAFGGNASSVFAAGLNGEGAHFCFGTRDAVGGGNIASWALMPIGVDAIDRSAVWSSGPNDIWLAGAFGRLDHWNGTAWTPARITLTKIPFTGDFHAIFGRPGMELWVVGSDVAYHKVLP